MPDHSARWETLERRLPVAAVAVAIPVLAYIGHPVVALLTGAAFGLVLDDAPVKNGQKIGKYLLQTAIVLIGFKMDIAALIEISAGTVGWVALFVVLTLLAGLGLGKLLTIEVPLARLIAVGTAICGGTAIATIAPLVKARADQVGLALAIVFLLNAFAMLTFPAIGAYLDMTQTQFGIWAAVAIHDTSSVVGTSAAYGEQATLVATAIKLGRTLWLIPLVLAFSLARKDQKAKAHVPGFIVLFVGAALISAVVDIPDPVTTVISATSKAFLAIALFFIGTEFRRATLLQLQGRVIWQALGLWGLALTTSLAVVLWAYR